jgi:hypothetical protein
MKKVQSVGFVHLPERWRKKQLPVKRPNAQRHYKAFIFIVADVQTSNLTSWGTYAYHNLTILTHLLSLTFFIHIVRLHDTKYMLLYNDHPQSPLPQLFTDLRIMQVFTETP